MLRSAKILMQRFRPMTARTHVAVAVALICCALSGASGAQARTSTCEFDGVSRFDCASLLPANSTSTVSFGRCDSPRHFDTDVLGILEMQLGWRVHPPKSGLLRLRYIDNADMEDDNPYVYKVNVRTRRHGMTVTNYSNKRIIITWEIRC